MGDQNNSSFILGFVPGRRVIGIAVADESSLQYFKAQWLKRFKTDGEKILIINRLLCRLMTDYKPRAIVTLKLTPHRETNFNLNLLSFLKGLANSRLCPLYSYNMTEIKAILGHKTIKNIRQLSTALYQKYPELKSYLPDGSTPADKDREKYYQPLFIATGLVNAYNKLIERKNEQLKLPC
jgi:hypothetical protein